MYIPFYYDLISALEGYLFIFCNFVMENVPVDSNQSYTEVQCKVFPDVVYSRHGVLCHSCVWFSFRLFPINYVLFFPYSCL